MEQVEFPVAFQENVTLAPFTTLGIGGAARFFSEATSEKSVLQALQFAAARKLPVFILGGGSNLVVSDSGFAGLVIRIALQGIRSKKGGLIVAAAGVDWDSLVCRCVQNGLGGIECLSGIPGTVGGTPVQNVGAYGQEVSEVITAVRALDRTTEKIVEFDKKGCGFAYRTSIFNTSHRDRYIVLSVSYQLSSNAVPRIEYPDLRRHFADHAGPPTIMEVREAVLQVRTRKSMVISQNDSNARSAGSFFKNPVVPANIAEQAEEAARRRGSLGRSEIMPRYPMPDGSLKLSAAWLIEHAGFEKGYRCGHVGLSSRHALALINCGGATSDELIALMREIQAAVASIYGIELVPEPVFVGFD